MRATFAAVFVFTACLAGAPLPVLAQAQAPPAFGITDNSFLIEEAFNQEAGVFQNIFMVSHPPTACGMGRSRRNGQCLHSATRCPSRCRSPIGPTSRRSATLR